MRTVHLAAALLLSLAAAHAQEVRKVAFRTLGLEPLPGLSEVHLPAATPKGKAVAVPILSSSLSAVVEGEFKGDEAVFFAKPGDTATPVANIHIRFRVRVAPTDTTGISIADSESRLMRRRSARISAAD